MGLAVVASLDKGFYVLVNTRQVYSEAGLCLGANNPLVCIMKEIEHCCTKTHGNKQAATVHDEVINTQMVFDTAKSLQEVRHGGLLVWEAPYDGRFKGLVCLISFSMVLKFLKMEVFLLRWWQ